MRYSWNKERSDNLVTKLVLFFIWPFAAWLYCFKEPRNKSSYVIFFLFSMLLLWHMAPTGINDSYDDFLGILNEFNNTVISTPQFIKEVIDFFTFSSDAPKELYQDFLTWFTKLFTDNYHFMFLFASIPVAYFQLKSLKLVTNDKLFIPGLYGILAMIMMIIPRDIITVQNPRFATGFWLLVFCSLYCFTKSKVQVKYLLPLLLLPAFHAGLWPALIMVALYLLLPKNTRILEALAVLSIPFIFIDPNISSFFSFNILPERLVEWVEGYTSDEAYARFILREGKSGFWWVDATFQIGLKVSYIILALQVIRNKRQVDSNPEAKNFYTYFLWVFFFINMVQFIPEMGNRYYNMWRVFVFFMWFKTFHCSRKFPYLLLLAFSSWNLFVRYGYVIGGALSVNTPPDIFCTPLPYLIGKGLFW